MSVTNSPITVTINPTEEDWEAWLQECQQTGSAKRHFYAGIAVLSTLVGALTNLLTSNWTLTFIAAFAMGCLVLLLKPLIFKFELRKLLRRVHKDPSKPQQISLYESVFRIQTEEITMVLPASDLQKFYTGPEGFIYMVFMNDHYPIPPSAFATSEQRQKFLSALAHLSSPGPYKQVWWAQESAPVSASLQSSAYEQNALMSITVQHSTEESKMRADQFSSSKEGKQAWQSIQLLTAFAWFILATILFKSLPVLHPMAWIAGTTVLLYFLTWLCYPLYAQRNIASCIEAGRNNRYTVSVTHEGIEYIHADSTIIYPWKSIHNVELLPDGFIIITTLEIPTYIPPSSFSDTQHRESFLNALTAGRKGNLRSASWWTRASSNSDERQNSTQRN